METKTANDQPLLPQQTPARKSPGGWWIVGGVAVIVAALVFAGGAFAANQLSAPPREGEFGRFGGQRPQFQMIPAAELPTATPNLQGVVIARNANTLSVGQRNGFGQGGGGNENTTVMDVVVGGDTTFYHDITQRNFDGQPPSGPIQQKVEPGSVDGINPNSRVTVWGDRSCAITCGPRSATPRPLASGARRPGRLLATPGRPPAFSGDHRSKGPPPRLHKLCRGSGFGRRRY